MRYSLPTNEVSAQNQLSLVKIYVQKSGDGANPVRIEEIKALSPVKSDRISKCHRFLVDIGLLIKEGHKYRPTKEAVRIINYFADGENYSAQERLRALVAETWFGSFIRELLRLVGAVDKDSLVQRMLVEAKLPDVDLNKEKAAVLIDWLLTADFIEKNSSDRFILNETPLLPESVPVQMPTIPVSTVLEPVADDKGMKIKFNVELSLDELSPRMRSEIIRLIKDRLA
ncbi:MAG: hypothetical protein KGZ93_08355 [Actinobacteria bacterium]|nr:hypothetical protein [Actinomycetota bacterium]